MLNYACGRLNGSALSMTQTLFARFVRVFLAVVDVTLDVVLLCFLTGSEFSITKVGRHDLRVAALLPCFARVIPEAELRTALEPVCYPQLLVAPGEIEVPARDAADNSTV